MQTNQSFTQPPRIYLTALLWIALGLVFMVVLVACSSTDETLQTGTQAVTVGTRTPYPTRTRASVGGTATASPTLMTTQIPLATPRKIRASEDDLQGVRIVFWHAWARELDEVMRGILTEFNLTNQWGITVEVHSFNGFGALGDAFAMARQEDEELPDLLSGYNYQALHWDVGGQVLVDLTPYVDDPLLGFSREEEMDFQPVFWSQDVVMVNTPAGWLEKRLGIPLHDSAQVLYYNRTWAEELGYDEIPDSLSSLRVQACAASEGLQTETDGSGAGGLMFTTEASTLLGWIYAYGGEVSSPLGGGYNFNTDEAERALKFMRSMVDSGCAWVGDSLQAAEDFASRGALIYTGSIAGLEAQEAAMRQSGNEDEWTVIAFPSTDGEPVIVSSGPALIMTQSTPQEELAAWLLIKWLVSSQIQSEWVQANDYYTTRRSTLDLLGTKLTNDVHWSAAVELLPFAHAEPGYASWRVMRWALSDAMTELFSPEFLGEEIPQLLERLDAVADEIHTQVR